MRKSLLCPASCHQLCDNKKASKENEGLSFLWIHYEVESTQVIVDCVYGVSFEQPLNSNVPCLDLPYAPRVNCTVPLWTSFWRTTELHREAATHSSSLKRMDSWPWSDVSLSLLSGIHPCGFFLNFQSLFEFNVSHSKPGSVEISYEAMSSVFKTLLLCQWGHDLHLKWGAHGSSKHGRRFSDNSSAFFLKSSTAFGSLM